MAEWIGCDGPRGHNRDGSPVPVMKGAPGCPARAFVHARFSSGGELHFCGHHGTEYMDELKRQALEVIDDRPRIAERLEAAVKTEAAFA